MKPVKSRYRCPACGKVMEREGGKRWRKSFCEETGKDVRIWRESQVKAGKARWSGVKEDERKKAMRDLANKRWKKEKYEQGS